MAVTADDVFKIVTVNKRDYTVTYGGKIIRDDGKVIQKTGGLAKHILREAGWHKDVLEEANQPTEEKEEEKEGDGVGIKYEEDPDSVPWSEFLTDLAGSLWDFLNREVWPEKKLDAVEGFYLSGDPRQAEKGGVYYRTADGAWYYIDPDTGEKIGQGKVANALERAAEYTGRLVLTEKGSDEYWDTMKRASYTKKNFGRLLKNYGFAKGTEGFVTFVLNAATNIWDYNPVALFEAWRSGDWSRQTDVDFDFDVDFVTNYAQFLADEMTEKGYPESVAFAEMLGALPIEILVEFGIGGLISKGGKLTGDGKLSLEAYEIEGDNVDWDKFFQNPQKYVDDLKKYSPEAPVPLNVTRVKTRELKRLEGTTAIPTGTVKVDTNALVRTTLGLPPNTLKVQTKPIKRTPVVIPEGILKVRHRELKRLTRVPIDTRKVSTTPLLRRTPDIPVGTTKVTTRTLVRVASKVSPGTLRVSTTPLLKRDIVLPTGTLRVKTNKRTRKPAKYTEAQIKVRTERLERLRKIIDAETLRVSTRPVGRLKKIVPAHIPRVKTIPLPRVVRIVLDTTAGSVITRKLERLLDKLPSTVYRIKARVLTRKKKPKLDANTVRVQTRNLDRRSLHIITGQTISVRTRVRNRLTYSALGDIYRTVVKTRPLDRKKRVVAIGASIIVETRPLRRTVSGIITSGIKIPLSSIRILTRPVRAIALFIPRVVIRILRRKYKWAKVLDVNIKIATNKIRKLTRRVAQAIPATVVRVTVRVVPRLGYVQPPEKEPFKPVKPITLPPSTTPDTSPTRRPIIGGGKPARDVGTLKGDVLSSGSATYRPGTGKRKPSGFVTRRRSQ